MPKRRQDLASKAKDSRLDLVVMFCLNFLLLTLAEFMVFVLFAKKGAFSFFGLVQGGSIMAERVLSYKNCLIPPLVLVLLTFSSMFLTIGPLTWLMAASVYEENGKRTNENELIPPLRVIGL